MSHPLELRVPPALLFLLATTAEVGLGRLGALPLPTLPGGSAIRTGLMVLGGVTILLGLIQFTRARTTVDPTHPEAASALVDGGIYRVTRNPMYLGMLLVLLAVVLRAEDGLALIPPVGFVLWMNRFQIGPEERALTKVFGAEYIAYCERVRRWI